MSCFSAADSGTGGDSGPAAASCRRVARARLSALVTDSSVEPRMRAASLAANPSTSRRISTARCRGGSRCTAVMKASEIASRASYLASGPGSASGRPVSRSSGQGSSQVTSPSRVGSGGAGPGGIVPWRRRAERRMFRQRVVVTRYSQVRTEARPSKPPSPCHAASSASCMASSASCTEPSIR